MFLTLRQSQATDIYVGGQPIGKLTDGNDYLNFLTVLKQKLGPNKLVAIAAPASYWYLKAFPIDRISKVIDYIVYMTYDLHGQWDYGKPHSFDSCDSGKCIRSHGRTQFTLNPPSLSRMLSTNTIMLVNLTETVNALAMGMLLHA